MLFRSAAPRRVWFDHPVHVPDTNNYLAVAGYSDSGSSGRGTGDNQTKKTDWFKTVDELLSFGPDTAVSLEAVGIKESNARSKFSKETNYEVATLGEHKVVHRRNEDKIIFAGKEYYKQKKGNRITWIIPGSESKNP